MKIQDFFKGTSYEINFDKEGAYTQFWHATQRENQPGLDRTTAVASSRAMASLACVWLWARNNTSYREYLLCQPHRPRQARNREQESRVKSSAGLLICTAVGAGVFAAVLCHNLSHVTQSWQWFAAATAQHSVVSLLLSLTGL